jgi:hypothetical protein
MDADFLADYFTLAELAVALDVAPRTIARWERLGEGPPRTEYGRRIVYRKQAVTEWLRAREKA